MFKNDPLGGTAPAPAGPVALSRRNLFKLGGLAAASVSTPAIARGFGTGFTHGVASGEPGQTRVMLWSRFVAKQDTTLEWEVSQSLDFAQIVSAGSVIATPSRDWCVKTWANGLTPGQWYYYRFTAPDGSQSEGGMAACPPRPLIWM